MNNGTVEIIARGMCIQEGQLLLCRTEGAENTYLPGGHVEFGESAKTALIREISEEMGRESKVAALLGVVEHTFEQQGETHCEINLVFALEIEGLSSGQAPESCEAHIAFLWGDMKELDDSGLEPKAVRSLIVEWSERGATGGWGSNYAD
jgi:ADP-ribose pyrophosphatase YjhB (NUDIX family)